MKHLRILVPGARDTHESLDITAPFDFAKIARADLADEQTIEQALQTAYDLYRDKEKWLSLQILLWYNQFFFQVAILAS